MSQVLGIDPDGAGERKLLLDGPTNGIWVQMHFGGINAYLDQTHTTGLNTEYIT